jgi:penicillin amidase
METPSLRSSVSLAIRSVGLRLATRLLLVGALGVPAGLPACGSNGGGGTSSDAGPDAVADAAGDAAADQTGDVTYSGPYAEARAGAIDQTLTLEGLNYPVHVRIDGQGIEHVLAESAEDAFFAQGFFHARDRFPQMELFRHATSGRLAELAGALDPSVIDDDLMVRLMGFGRVGKAIYDDLAEGSLERRVLDAYAAGVNAYIARLRTGDETIPQALQALIDPATVADWTPWDGLSIIRYEQADLGFDARTEIALTATRAAAQAVFSADADDPRLAARAGILGDLERFAPSDPTYIVPGFTGSSQKAAQRRRDIPGGQWHPPTREALTAASHLLDLWNSRWLPHFGDPRGMSNSWAVSGALSADGHAMLANDPHLSLNSPTVFHQIHLVVEPRTQADGPALNVYGLMFPGLPGILLGHNAHVAWGLTTASYDYSDAYTEQLVHHDGEPWPNVMHNGEEVPLTIYHEQLQIGARGQITETRDIDIPYVPGHGPLALDIQHGAFVMPQGNEAISLAWRGFEPSNELAALVAWMTADNVGDAEAGLAGNWVIGTQNLLFADTDGNILCTGESYIPVRPAAAMTWDPVDNPGGTAPWWTLSGTGEHDWLPDPLAPDLIPRVENPSVGYIVTANNDQAGVTDDNNPLNDYAYLGYSYDIGFRAGRITRLVSNATGNWPEGHLLTLEDLGTIQADHHSNVGERLAPFLVAAADAALAEYETPGSHPDLTALLADHAGAAARVQTLRDILAGWSYTAEDGLWGTPTQAQKDDAVATSLFNVWTTAVVAAAFGDERAAAPQMTQIDTIRGLLWILEHPTECATTDADTGQSILWDDLSTDDVQETRDDILVASLFTADAELSTLFGSSTPGDWLWGRLHTRKFDHLVPDTSDLSNVHSDYDWPSQSEGYPNGYPRPGDTYLVDACDGGYSDYNYRCGGGPTQRLLVDLDPAGVHSMNSIPGGQVEDASSPHFRDLLDLWLNWQWFPVRFQPGDVAGAPEGHLLLVP